MKIFGLLFLTAVFIFTTTVSAYNQRLRTLAPRRAPSSTPVSSMKLHHGGDGAQLLVHDAIRDLQKKKKKKCTSKKCKKAKCKKCKNKKCRNKFCPKKKTKTKPPPKKTKPPPKKKQPFRCPPNSYAKLGEGTYDSFNDCLCNDGYFKRRGKCDAEKGLCTEEYAEMLETKQTEVEFWIAMAEAAENTNEEKGEAVLNISRFLEEAYDLYNKGKASCELYGTDGKVVVIDEFFGNNGIEDIEGGRRLRFFRRIKSKFKKVAEKFKTIAAKAVKVVASVVDVVVDVVLELVECGVGIVTDGAKCGLIGCAFGLMGVAADIAFTLATGGIGRATAVACDLTEVVADLDASSAEREADEALEKAKEDKQICASLASDKFCKKFDREIKAANEKVDEAKKLRADAEKKRKDSNTKKLIQGVGGAVCALNEKIESPVLGFVCDAKENLKEAVGVDILDLNPVVKRFIEFFKKAMCGSPGSAVMDILEEVVACEIGCADEDNAFCGE